MKMTNKCLVFVGAALCLASCDLDKLPEGQYVGDGQYWWKKIMMPSR